jgi:plastocyanin
MKRFALVVCAWLAIGVTGLVVAATPDAAVTVQLFKFRPDRLEAKSGTRVTWTNQDDIGHTVTSGTPEAPDRAFELRLAGKGATGAFEFVRPGVFPYFCTRHPAMRGEIHVNPL